ncbi:3821_t:CDS:2 [Dentiscutata erythropus]|uniref:3821_t:CDS:1 n=1 Tax=Dentiscutata erythropus TaxID=1348616 RepID=A0A9N9I2C8_9GLOM|nr:3821_t:CDS:2 [Dentiscutata erythropus]
MNLKKITNYSLRRTAIQILTQLNVNTDRIIAFSGHCSLGGVASYQTFTKEIINTTVAMIIPESSRLPLVPISNLDNQIAHQIHPRITKPRPFKPFDTSKPFVSLLKRSSAKIIEKDTQEILPAKIIEEDIQKILPAITSNTAQEMPRIIVENCSNCNIEIKITMK